MADVSPEDPDWRDWEFEPSTYPADRRRRTPLAPAAKRGHGRPAPAYRDFYDRKRVSHYTMPYSYKSKSGARIRDYRKKGKYVGRAGYRRQSRPLYAVPSSIPVGPAPAHKVVKLAITKDISHQFKAAEYAYSKVMGNTHYQAIRVQSNVAGSEDAGVTNAQMYGWSEWEQFYDQYRITACKITAKFYIMAGSDSEFPVVASLWAQDDAETVSTSIEVQKEGLKARQVILDTAAGAGHVRTLSMARSTRQVLGPIGKSNTVNGTGTAGNPNDQWEYILFFDTMADQSRGATDVRIFVRLHMEYIVHFFDRKTLSQSTQ